MAAFCGLLVLIGIFALLYNKGKFPKLPGFNVVDDAKWAAVLIFSLQIWDFYSDLNLSVEIWNHPKLTDDILILVAAIGSTLFVFIPYFANLAIAAKIKTFVSKNICAKGWFQYHTPVFVLMVVFTGGAYPALALVSSQIFGLKLMSCGLTQHELKRLGKIKVVGTVLLENVPQLVCQVIYAKALNEITQAVQLAFIASLLSVTASTLSWLIEKDTSDTDVVHYFLSVQCDREANNANNDASYDEMNIPISQVPYSKVQQTNVDDDTDGEMGETNTKKYQDVYEDYNDDVSVDGTTITVEERQNIIDNRGRTEALGEQIAEAYEITTKNIEVGHSMITKHGLIMHVVHYVYNDNLEVMEAKLREQNITTQINVTPRYFTEQTFLAYQKNIKKVLRVHFDLSKNICVAYHNRLGGKAHSQHSVDDKLKRVVTHAQIELAAMNKYDTDEKSYDEFKIKMELKKLLSKEGAMNKKDRLNVLSNLIETIDNETTDDKNDESLEIEIEKGIVNEMDVEKMARLTSEG
eukprot:1943_1